MLKGVRLALRTVFFHVLAQEDPAGLRLAGTRWEEA